MKTAESTILSKEREQKVKNKSCILAHMNVRMYVCCLPLVTYTRIYIYTYVCMFIVAYVRFYISFYFCCNGRAERIKCEAGPRRDDSRRAPS